MFNKYGKTEITRVTGPHTGPDGVMYQLSQHGKPRGGKLFKPNEYAAAEEKKNAINDSILEKNPRLIAALSAITVTSLVACAAVGFAYFSNTESSTTQDTGANPPAPTATRFITSTVTQFVTESPKPLDPYNVSKSKVILKLKPTPQPTHHAHVHHQNVSVTSVPQAPPTSVYVPPAETYTPPPAAAKPTHAPSLTVRHLHEH